MIMCRVRFRFILTSYSSPQGGAVVVCVFPPCMPTLSAAPSSPGGVRMLRMITKQDVSQAMRRQRKTMQERPRGKARGAMKHTHSIDPVLFHNTRMVGSISGDVRMYGRRRSF